MELSYTTKNLSLNLQYAITYTDFEMVFFSGVYLASLGMPVIMSSAALNPILGSVSRDTPMNKDSCLSV